MEFNLLYQSKNGNIFTCRQLLGNPLLVHVNDRNQADHSQISGGVEIVGTDGQILYLSIDFEGMEDVVLFFYHSVEWLTQQEDAFFHRYLVENSGTTLSAKRNELGVLLSCRTDGPDKDRDFEDHFIPLEEWISAATLAIDEFLLVFDHHPLLAKDWATLKG
jgi:hypothetical protein